MNKQQAKERLEIIKPLISDLTSEANELLAIIDKPERFVPNHGSDYWYLTDSYVEWDGWYNDRLDLARLERGNVYATEAEAKRADKKRMAIAKYERIIAEGNDGVEFDWNDDDQKKYYAYFSFPLNKVCFCWDALNKCRDNSRYSHTIELAEQAVSQLTAEEIELIFKS